MQVQRWSMTAMVIAACAFAGCAVSDDDVRTSEPDPTDELGDEAAARNALHLDELGPGEMLEGVNLAAGSCVYADSPACPPGGQLIYVSSTFACGAPFCGGLCAKGAAIGIRTHRQFSKVWRYGAGTFCEQYFEAPSLGVGCGCDDEEW